jgi:hypothetical protein
VGLVCEIDSHKMFEQKPKKKIITSKRGGLTVGCLGHNFKEKSQVLSSFTFQKIKII